MTDTTSAVRALLISEQLDLAEETRREAVRTGSGGEVPAVEITPGYLTSNDITQADVIIYDLDITHGDADHIRDDLLRIRSQTRSKPVIVIGNPEMVDITLSNPKLSECIDRHLKKPVFRSQLVLAIDALGSHLSAEAADSKQGPISSVLIKSAVPLVLLAIAAGLLWVGMQQQQAPVVQTTSKTETAPLQEDLANADPQAEIISSLLSDAARAESAGRLISPENDNALYYYEQILEIDSFDPVAYQGRKRVLKRLESSINGLLESAAYEEAAEIAEVLAEAEPLNESYQKLVDTVQAANDKQSADSDARETEQDSAQALANNESTVQSERAVDPRSARGELTEAWVQRITAALSSERLVPPQPDNAFSLIEGALRNDRVNNDEIRPLIQKLAGSLEINIRQHIDNARLADARQDLGFLQRLGVESALLGELSDSIEQQRLAQESAGSSSDRNTPVDQVSEPEIIDRVDPTYPRRAQRLDIQGWVEVQYEVDAEGQVINARVTQAEPGKIFNQAGLEAINQWRFTPARNMESGEPVVSETQITRFNFSLSDG